ncbi:hypothetical protein SFK1770_5543 [Shigella flexneri K-1770]|nr:hypothetical protein SFK1770_5543 [Shigella flexneri K-1770]
MLSACYNKHVKISIFREEPVSYIACYFQQIMMLNGLATQEGFPVD